MIVIADSILPPRGVKVLGYHKFVYSGDRGVGSESPVVEGEGLLGHLPETVRAPRIGQTVLKGHVMPGGRLPPVHLSFAGNAPTGGFLLMVEVSPDYGVVGVEFNFAYGFP
jgi:hypothetical protein